MAGVYFPVWGTCLGFELLTYLAGQRENILTDCHAENVAMPLLLKPGTVLFSDLAVVNIMRSGFGRVH
jgi:hypothetical protein